MTVTVTLSPVRTSAVSDANESITLKGVPSTATMTSPFSSSDAYGRPVSGSVYSVVTSGTVYPTTSR